jgi:hypothetical protein
LAIRSVDGMEVMIRHPKLGPRAIDGPTLSTFGSPIRRLVPYMTWQGISQATARVRVCSTLPGDAADGGGG